MTKEDEDKISLSEQNPSLAHLIEDVILFGKREELDNLVDQLSDHPDITEELRYGLEGLKYFRAHYNATSTQLSPAARQRVAQFDTSWSMQLIDLLRSGQATVAQEKIA